MFKVVYFLIYIFALDVRDSDTVQRISNLEKHFQDQQNMVNKQSQQQQNN